MWSHTFKTFWCVLSSSMLDFLNFIRDRQIVKTPWVVEFFVELITTVKTIEFINFINVIQRGIDIFSWSVLFEYLEASFIGVLVFNEESWIGTGFIVHVEWGGCPFEKETRGIWSVSCSVLYFVSVLPGISRSFGTLLVYWALFTHLFDLSFINVPFRSSILRKIWKC